MLLKKQFKNYEVHAYLLLSTVDANNKIKQVILSSHYDMQNHHLGVLW